MTTVNRGTRRSQGRSSLEETPQCLWWVRKMNCSPIPCTILKNNNNIKENSDQYLIWWSIHRVNSSKVIPGPWKRHMRVNGWMRSRSRRGTLGNAKYYYECLIWGHHLTIGDFNCKWWNQSSDEQRLKISPTHVFSLTIRIYGEVTHCGSILWTFYGMIIQHFFLIYKSVYWEVYTIIFIK